MRSFVVLCGLLLAGLIDAQDGSLTAPTMPNAYSMTVTIHEKKPNSRKTNEIVSSFEYDHNEKKSREDFRDAKGQVKTSVLKVVEGDKGFAYTWDHEEQECTTVQFDPAELQHFPPLSPDMRNEGVKEIDGIYCNVWSSVAQKMAKSDYRVWMNGTLPIQEYSAAAEAAGVVKGIVHFSDYSQHHGETSTRLNKAKFLGHCQYDSSDK